MHNILLQLELHDDKVVSAIRMPFRGCGHRAVNGAPACPGLASLLVRIGIIFSCEVRRGPAREEENVRAVLLSIGLVGFGVAQELDGIPE